MSKTGFVYILASNQNGTIYTGVTSNLPSRIEQHKHHDVQGFTSKYNVDKLVWYEQHDTIEAAIGREKQIKRWNRLWKLRLIERDNPKWNDLSAELLN